MDTCPLRSLSLSSLTVVPLIQKKKSHRRRRWDKDIGDSSYHGDSTRRDEESVRLPQSPRVPRDGELSSLPFHYTPDRALLPVVVAEVEK